MPGAQHLDTISEFLYINNFIIHQKIGDFYVYKSQNIILPSPKVFVKINKKNNTILTHATDINWIKEGLEEITTTKSNKIISK